MIFFEKGVMNNMSRFDRERSAQVAGMDNTIKDDCFEPCTPNTARGFVSRSEVTRSDEKYSASSETRRKQLVSALKLKMPLEIKLSLTRNH